MLGITVDPLDGAAMHAGVGARGKTLGHGAAYALLPLVKQIKKPCFNK